MPTCATCGYKSENDFNFCPTCGSSSGGTERGGLVGRSLNGKYKVGRQIGEGAMGVVYEGEHVALQKRVALKVLHPDLGVTDESMRRFQQEGIAAGRFSHLGAIQIFDFDRDGDRILYLAMEYIDGEDLKTYLRRKGRLAPAEAVAIGVQTLSVLSEAHELGIIHRDLKPDNIMVIKHSGDGVLIKVLDFGLSKLVDVPHGASMQTQVGRIMGTPLYMAPEQVAGDDVDHRVDIYATGLILYELLAGVTPFPDQSTTEILFSRATREAPSITESFPDLGIPPRLDVILKQAMERRRDDRFSTAAEMLERFEALVGGALEGPDARSRSAARTAPLLGQVQEPKRGVRSLPWMRIGVVAALAIVLTLAFQAGRGGANSGGETDRAGDTRTEDPSTQGLSSQEGGQAVADQRVRRKGPTAQTAEEQLYLGHIDTAERAFQAGDRDGALVHVNDAMALDLPDPEALALRARIFFEDGDYAAARADAELGRGLFSWDLELANLAGWIELSEERFDQAELAFQSATAIAERLDPKALAPTLAGRSALELARNDVEGAKALAEEAIELDGGLAQAHRVLGEIALVEEDPTAAQASLFRARSLAPGDWRTYMLLGRSYIQAGDLIKAERQLTEARSRNADALEVRQLLAATFVERELWPQARDEVRDALSRSPGDGRLLILRGIILAADGETQGAIDDLTQGLSAGVRDGAAHALLGTLHHGRQEIAAARDHYQSARTLDDQLVQPWLNLGLIDLAAGRWEEAIVLLEGALERDSNLSTALFALGIAHRDYAGDPAAALVAFKRYQDVGGHDNRVDAWIDELGG